MEKPEVTSFRKIMQEEFFKCKSDEERWNKVIDVLCSNTQLIDVLIKNLPVHVQRRIMDNLGFKEHSSDGVIVN